VTLLSPEARRSLVAGLVKQGVPTQRANIAVDLAAQACDQANDAFTRAVKLAPDASVGLCATQIGSQIMVGHMASLVAGTERLAKAYGFSHATVAVKL
jgi:hypothetical protein